ncbi:MAG: hypothetical protein D6739_03620 [Nitrospirae bacterium]|nr:MAG: hypothetical protein D6739_03620 [Nitrospirota bacterium]
MVDPGAVEGRVVLGQDLHIDPDQMDYPSPELFGHDRAMERELVVDPEGGVKNAIVSVAGVDHGLPAKPAELSLLNKELEFEPRVQVAPRGSTLVIRNADDVLHNVHAFQHRRNLFNVALPSTKVVARERLRRTGLISIRCDISHPWMTAFIFVSPHPYAAVSDAAGRFRIEGLPPGRYTLDVWHERLGEIQLPVVVARGATTHVEAVFHAGNRLKHPSPWLVFGR